MKLLSFVGTGEYKETSYFYGDTVIKTRYIQEALMRIFKPSEVVLFVTEDAYKKHGEHLKEALKHVKFVSIPIPKKQEDIWVLFEAIINSIEDEDEFILDITHAFRHIPFISFLVLLYAQEVKNAKIKGVYYGAFEAPTDGKTPIFELNGLLSLTEWLYGIRELRIYGRGEGLVKAIQQGNVTGHLKQYPEQINKILKYLQLNQIPSFMRESKRIKQGYPSFKKQAVKHLPPIVPVLSEIERLTKFDGCTNLDKDCLQKQIEVMEYQLEKGMTANALELMREWIVNAILYLLGSDGWLDRDRRKEAEDTVNWFCAKMKKEPWNRKKPSYVDVLKEEPVMQRLIKLWEDVTKIRNSIAHAGMNKNNPKPGTIEKKAKRTLEEIRNALEELHPVSSLLII